MADRESPSILHVDMDSFFVSVEVLDDPSLRGEPVIVGGSGDRGVVASASYEARAYGVHSAMPSVRARRLCPHARFIAGRYARYAEVSELVLGIFRSYTPLVEPISLDEAFLDVAGARRLFGDPPAIGAEIRSRVSKELGLSCSVGVATSKFIAKLASEAAKPRASPRGPIPGDGVRVIDPGAELAFLHPLPVQALWGVGPATLERLRRIGISTVGDLAALPRSTLIGAVGEAHGTHLHELANGIDERSVVPDLAPKSIGHEETFAEDHHEHPPLEREVVRMADSVAGRLRKHHLAGRTVTIKVRFHDFRTITRATTLPSATDAGPDVARAAKGLLAQIDPSSGVRLLGVSVSGLQPDAARQLSLGGIADGPASRADRDDRSWDDASPAIDAVRARFGDDAIVPATLVDPGGIRVKRRGDQQWGPEER